MIKMKKTTSIFTKGFLLVTLLSLLTGTIIVVLAIGEQSMNMEKSLVRENVLLARVASKSIETGYLINQWPFEELEKIGNSKDILFLLIVKPDGRVYMANRDSMWGNKINSSFLNTGVKDIYLHNTNERVKLIVQPINIGDKQWFLCLGVSLKSVGVATNSIIVKGISVLSIILLIDVVVAFYFTKTFTDPVRKLIKSTKQISKGNLNYKVKIESNDEFGELAEAFDEMRLSLKSRNELLNSILKTFNSKFGNIAVALLRIPIKKAVKKDAKILGILPKSMMKSIKKDLKRK